MLHGILYLEVLLKCSPSQYCMLTKDVWVPIILSLHNPWSNKGGMDNASTYRNQMVMIAPRELQCLFDIQFLLEPHVLDT